MSKIFHTFGVIPNKTTHSHEVATHLRLGCEPLPPKPKKIAWLRQTQPAANCHPERSEET
jgi:hypothetical protein